MQGSDFLTLAELCLSFMPPSFFFLVLGFGNKWSSCVYIKMLSVLEEQIVFFVLFESFLSSNHDIRTLIMILEPGWLRGKEHTCQGRRPRFYPIPRLGRSPGGGNGNPLQYSCLGNPMNRGAWWATVHEVAKS